MAEDGWKGKRRGRPWGDKCMRSHPKSAGGGRNIRRCPVAHFRISVPRDLFALRGDGDQCIKRRLLMGRSFWSRRRRGRLSPLSSPYADFPPKSLDGNGGRAGELWAHLSLPSPLCASDCENASPLSMQCSQRRPPGLYLCGTIKRHQGKRG